MLKKLCCSGPLYACGLYHTGENRRKTFFVKIIKLEKSYNIGEETFSSTLTTFVRLMCKKPTRTIVRNPSIGCFTSQEENSCWLINEPDIDSG